MKILSHYFLTYWLVVVLFYFIIIIIIIIIIILGSILVGVVLKRSRFVFQMMLAATLQWHAPYMALVSP